MPLSKKEVAHIAKLAQIELTTAELESLPAELSKILHFVEELNELQLQDVAPTSHPLALSDVFREDHPASSYSVADALKNAAQAEKEMFSVPKIFNN
ncbi:MAG: aspartyl/glutamyl-tRNA(Asn/Gln) amidotransferase subunit [Bacillota bacterium]|jgi:aspartyl-tRNA(Asn)/glutamyl-tRNA(Gln) amidotransferase subunit C